MRSLHLQERAQSDSKITSNNHVCVETRSDALNCLTWRNQVMMAQSQIFLRDLFSKVRVDNNQFQSSEHTKGAELKMNENNENTENI